MLLILLWFLLVGESVNIFAEILDRKRRQRTSIYPTPPLTQNITSSMALRLYIIVHEGEPLDLHETRHTALFVSKDNEREGDILHITGGSPSFSFERRQQEDPTTIKTFVKKIPVEPLVNSPTKGQLVSRIMTTPVKNSDPSWNCQNWVGDALDRLVQGNWITSRTSSDAIGLMADVIIEARDEE